MKLLLPVGLLAAVSLMTVSCDDDDVPVIENADAGTFTITNLSADGTVVHDNAELMAGDTLKVAFTPSSEYKDFVFTVSCEPLVRVKDSIYVVPDDRTDSRNTVYSKDMPLILKAVYDSKTKDVEYKLSATKTVQAKALKASAEVTWIMMVSPDLLDFFSLQLNYTDGNSTKHIVTLTDDQWTSESYTKYVYQNAEGKTRESDHEIFEEGWTKVSEEEILLDYRFSAKLYYSRIDTTYPFTVKYIQKTQTPPEKTEYDFFRSLAWGNAITYAPDGVHPYTGTNKTLLYEEDTVKKADLPTNLSTLASTEDHFELIIAHDGILKVEKSSY